MTGPILLLVTQHRPQPRSWKPPPALSPWAGSAGPLGAGPRTWRQVKAWPLPSRSSLPPSPLGAFQALGMVRLWEHGREGEAGHTGATAAVWYSHYQGAARASPASALATVAAFTPPLCLLTQGHLPQGRRCRLGNEGVRGPPKQSSSRSSQKPQKDSLGWGWEAAGPHPGRPREEVGPVSWGFGVGKGGVREDRSSESTGPLGPSPGSGGWCITRPCPAECHQCHQEAQRLKPTGQGQSDRASRPPGLLSTSRRHSCPTPCLQEPRQCSDPMTSSPWFSPCLDGPGPGKSVPWPSFPRVRIQTHGGQASHHGETCPRPRGGSREGRASGNSELGGGERQLLRLR